MFLTFVDQEGTLTFGFSVAVHEFVHHLVA